MVYVPNHFRMDNPDILTEFIHAHSFGTLISISGNEPIATHLPLLYDGEHKVLFGHMAKANHQWRNIDGQSVLVIFSGPHAYISPSWYEVPNSVPTWNYVTVHAYGRCSIVTDATELASLLDKTVRFFEPNSELAGRSDEPFYQSMMNAIVGFRIDIRDIQGAAKLSQNKPVDVRQRVISKLQETGDFESQRVAEWMEHWPKD